MRRSELINAKHDVSTDMAMRLANVYLSFGACALRNVIRLLSKP